MSAKHRRAWETNWGAPLVRERPSKLRAITRCRVCEVFALGLLGIFTATIDARGADWPQFLGPTANGVSPETGLLDRWSTNGPPLVWDKVVGTGYSAPSVRGNLLLLHHRVRNEEIVEAFEADTGKSRWRYAYLS